MAEREVVLELAPEIISAHVRNNAVPPDQLPSLNRSSTRSRPWSRRRRNRRGQSRPFPSSSQ
jgi:predicted transcriptional regulator